MDHIVGMMFNHNEADILHETINDALESVYEFRPRDTVADPYHFCF